MRRYSCVCVFMRIHVYFIAYIYVCIGVHVNLRVYICIGMCFFMYMVVESARNITR